MNDMKIGFIGAGNMASAIVGGAVKSGKFASNDIYVCDINEEKVNKLKNESSRRSYGVFPRFRQRGAKICGMKTGPTAKAVRSSLLP